MKMKRILCIILCLLLTVSIFNGCGTNSHSQDAVEMDGADDEIRKAIALGFVPSELQGSYDEQISYQEFCAVLDNFTSILFPDAFPTWEKVSADYREANNPMSRMEGALVFLYAAQCCGIDAVGYDFNIPLEDIIDDYVDFYEGVSWYYPLLPNGSNTYYNETLAQSEHYSWRCTLDYFTNAKIFAEYMSYGNGKTFFDYDERYSLNLGRRFTRKDAIHAVERLYENARFVLSVPAEQVSCTVPDTVVTLGTNMPQVVWNQLPKWHGYTVNPGYWNPSLCAGMHYQPELIEVLQTQGFNFVRVPLDARMIFMDENMTMVNPAYLETMDDLLEYCAEAGIHVCFDLHDMVGFYTGGDDSQITLWHDENTQKNFAAFWRFLAQYYRKIPANLLSFNLLNEPHSADDNLTDAVYSEIMLAAIDAIRAETPDRVIFVDMLGFGWQQPVQGLLDAQVVQAVHPYILVDGTRSWPAYTIDGFIHRNNGVLTLNGAFPAGTEISLTFTAVHSESTFKLEADKKNIATLALGTEAVEENTCYYIGEEGTDGEFRNYGGVVLNSTLADACSQITLKQEGGWWYQLKHITITTDNYSITIHTDGGLLPDTTTPELSISESGNVTAKRDGTLIYKSREWLDELFSYYREAVPSVMVQEFGYNETIDYAATLAAAEDYLSVLEEKGIPWCCWWGNYGPLADSRDADWYQLLWNQAITRHGAEYKMVSENWMMDTALMEIFQKHMG